MDTRLNASDSVACVAAIKGNFNTLEYSLAKHISHVPTKLNGVEFTDENAESWGGVTPPHTPPLATPLMIVVFCKDSKFYCGKCVKVNPHTLVRSGEPAPYIRSLRMQNVSSYQTSDAME